MTINVVKDENGSTIQWEDMDDNRITKIINHLHKHFCNGCGASKDDMEFIEETGYYDRTVTLKCKCGKIVRYQG